MRSYGSSASLVYPRQQHRKFIATYPGRNAGASTAFGQHFASAAQHGVTCGVALLIIDGLGGR